MKSHPDDIELIQLKGPEEAILQGQKIATAVGFLDSVNFGGIFALFLKDFLRQVLEQTLKYILFPLAILTSAIQALLAWRDAKLARGRHGTLVRAIIETIAFAAITTAIIGALAFTALFANIPAMIFTIVLGGKTFFHAGSAAYYLGKSTITNNPAEKKQYREIAKGNAIASVACLFSASAVVGVMLLGKEILAILGLVASVIGISFSSYRGYQLYKASHAKKSDSLLADDQKPDTLHSTAHIKRNIKEKVPNLFNSHEKTESSNRLLEEPTKAPPQTVSLFRGNKPTNDIRYRSHPYTKTF